MLQYSPKIVTDGLVMCLDASQNKSYPVTDLPIKDRLNLWLDAADDTTFSYSSGTTISQWRDKSGQNNHAIVNGGSPVRSVAINSRKAVSFTSTSWFKCTTGTFASNATHFLVCRATTSSATYQRVYNGGSDGYLFFGALANNIATFWGTLSSGWIDTNVNSPSITILNTLRIISAINNGSTGTPYYDGTAMSTKTTTNSFAYTGYELNSYSNGVISQPLIGEVCEIIVFNKQLSATELKQVHTYLGQKWGISNTDKSVIDLSGNNNDGLLGNGIVADMPSADYYNKGALRFDGSSDYLKVTDNVILSPTTVTVSMWLKRNAYQSSICNFLRRNDRDSYALMATNNTDAVWFRIRNSVAPVDAQTSMPLNAWTNLVGTFDGSNVRIYKNGALANTAANTSPISYSGSTIGDLIIARDDVVSGRYAPINVGSTLIYSRALSATEIAQNYEAQKSKFVDTIVQQGLVLNLDAGNIYSYAGAGSTWYDVSGNSFNATLNNSPTYTTDNGGVLNWISASSQYATVSMSSTLRVANITQEAWVYLSTTADQVFIGSQYGTSSNNSFALWVSGGTFYFGVNVGGTFYQSASSAPSTSTWYHLVHTYNGTTQYLYINGVLVTTYNSAASGNISYDTSNTLLAIGADFNGTGYNVGPSLYVNGKMPVIRIYNTALSAAQVLQNYNATKGRFGL